MRKLILIVHTSLDGFVAGPQGQLDGFEPGEENLAFVASLTRNADAAMFGRVSYELLEAHWPTVKDDPKATPAAVQYSTWYAAVKKIVISNTLTDPRPDVQLITKDLQQHIQALKAEPGKNILIFGSPSLTQWLMEEDLIDQYWIFVNPVIFGSGIQLYPKGGSLRHFTLAAQEIFPNGEIALCYNRKAVNES